MKALSEFFPRLLPYLPGCSEPLAAQAILDSAIKFCEDTLVVNQALSSFDTVVGQSDYTLSAPASQEVARVLKVVVNGDSELEATLAHETGELPADNAFPLTFFTVRSDGVFNLRLAPKPDGVYPVVVTVALRPTRDAATVQDELFTRWSDAIVFGALSRVYAIPGQPFSSLPLAGQYTLRAAQAAQRARIESSYGRVRGSMSVTVRPFA